MVITTASRQITAPRVISARRNPVAWREDLASIDSERRQFRTEVQLCRRGFIRPRAEHPGRGRSSPAGQKNSTCRPCRPVCFHRNDSSVGPAPTPRRESCPDRPTRRVAWWWLEPRGVHLEHATVRGTFAGSNLTAKSDPQRRASWTLHLPRSASAGSPRRR